MPLIRDLKPLLALHLALLIATLLLAGGNLADIRVQVTWTLYMALGWLIAPFWIGNLASPLRRYLAAMISTIAVHGLLAAMGSLVDVSMHVYAAVAIVGVLIAGFLQIRRLKSTATGGVRIPLQHLLVAAAVVLFVISVYRNPRSNDIHQFILQQQEMLANLSMRVSPIGMEAMEVRQPMPRWNAHYWHLLPCMLAYFSGIAVDQVLLRYATIPIAFSSLLCLIEIIRSLAGRHARYPFVLLAIVGPVVLWYRNYTAFNYSFRITNNLLLDKDFALFFLIPAVIWLSKGWVGGKRRYALPLLALIPAIIRFHPLSAVYLTLLTVPFAALASPFSRVGFIRGATLAAASLSLFAVVFLLGDAQSNHEQIRQIIEMDYQQSLADRPTHYWVGFYNVIPETTLPSDTTEWTDGRLHLKSSLITGCGLLAAMHLGLIALAVDQFRKTRTRKTRRVLCSGLLAIAMLWGMWAVSGAFLTKVPHYTAGYERLHWFAYPIALTVVSLAITNWIPRRGRTLVEFAIIVFVAISSAFHLANQSTPLLHLRGLNSLLDAELASSIQRTNDWDHIDPSRQLIDLRPDYLQPEDRVLLLDLETTKHYWLIRQGVFWCDPYVEAFAWFQRGDDFLTDRKFFYDLLDRVNTTGFDEWLKHKRITLIVDQREGGDPFIEELSRRSKLRFMRVTDGVWRIDD